MKHMICRILAVAGIAGFSAQALAGDIKVTTAADGVINAASAGGGLPLPLPAPIGGGTAGGNPTPGACSLREAMHVAEGLPVAATVGDCVDNNGNARAGVYCPFSGSNNSTAGECIAGATIPGTNPAVPVITGDVTGPSADTITFHANARGTVPLLAPLPIIRNPVTITGLGPDQSVITGNAVALINGGLAFVPPAYTRPNFPAFPNDTNYFELAIFQIHPDLPSGAEVKLEQLTVRGARAHFYRSRASRPTARFGNGNANEGLPSSCGNFGNNTNQAPCCGTGPEGRTVYDTVNNAGAGNPPEPLTLQNMPACGAYTSEPGDATAPGGAVTNQPQELLGATKSVINFSGLIMDHGAATAARKKLTLDNTRFSCNRRGDNRPTAATGTPVQAAGHLIGFPSQFLGGGALSVLGRAQLNIRTASFSNNVSEFGDGGAVFAGAKDNGSPEVNVIDSRFDDDGGQSCTDSVLAMLNDGTGATAALCNANSSTGSAISPCPAGSNTDGSTGVAFNTGVYLSGASGNFAGASLLDGAFSTRRISGPIVPAVAAANPPATLNGVTAGNGGALAVNALNATLGNIGQVFIGKSEQPAGSPQSSGTRFENSSARGDGGAVSIAHVAQSQPNGRALTINGALFTSPGNTATTGNKAAGNGGALSIIGNANQTASVKMDFVSFSFNTANDDGGALHYVTRPGAAIDFSLTNVRMGFNSANRGGALFAADNTADDSGILNLSKTTLDNNSSVGVGGALYCGATKDGSQFTNVTLSNNFAGFAGGGIFVGDRCHLDLNNASIVDNGAGLFGTNGLGQNGGGGIFVMGSPPFAGEVVSNNARVELRNSILARNRSRDNVADPAIGDINSVNGADCSAPNSDVLRTAGFNFVGTISGCSTAFVAGQTSRTALPANSTLPGNTTDKCLRADTGDIVGSTAVPACAGVPLNPLLRILTDNGGADIQGARNFTHHPETDSPVINNAASSGCRDGLGAAIPDDERGFFRTGSAGRCDIGAVEVGGGLTPTLATLSVLSNTTNLPTTIRLPSTELEVEMLRVGFTAPVGQRVEVESLTIRPEDPEGGIAGFYDAAVARYGALRGIEVTVVDSEGRDLSNPLFRAIGDQDLPPFRLNRADATDTTRLLRIPFNAPIPIEGGQTAFVSVRFIFEHRVVRLVRGESGIMLAAAGGVGLLSFLGLMGAGMSRRKSLVLACVLLALTAAGGCSSDDDDESFDEGSRTFRISAREVVFDTQAASDNRQNISVVGETITVVAP